MAKRTRKIRADAWEETIWRSHGATLPRPGGARLRQHLAAVVPACAPPCPRASVSALWEPGPSTEDFPSLARTFCLSSQRAHRQWMATPCSPHPGKTCFPLCPTQCPSISVLCYESLANLPCGRRGLRGAREETEDSELIIKSGRGCARSSREIEGPVNWPTGSGAG